MSIPTMIGPDEALCLVAESVGRLSPQVVPLAETCGLQLAEAVVADRDYPPFARAMMDGYAVRVADAGRTVAVVGEVAAGQYIETEVAAGQCVGIMTGAPCPAGSDAVVPKERVRRNENRVTLPKRIAHGEHIVPRGSECPAGQTVLREGETVTPLAVAVMASFGLDVACVTPRPTLAVITTGAELIGPGREPAPAQIRDSNGPMLVAMARDMGLGRLLHLHAEDRREAIVGTLRQAADRDIVLLTGGVSVGKYDLVPEALQDHEAELIFHKVRQKPGKPLLLARRGSQVLFGLPGNPLASHFCFHRYVAAAIRRMGGKDPLAEPIEGRLTEPVPCKKGRTYFIPARARPSIGEGCAWSVDPLPGRSSADVFGAAGANCYVEIPPGSDSLPAGQSASVCWIGAAPWSN